MKRTKWLVPLRSLQAWTRMEGRERHLVLRVALEALLLSVGLRLGGLSWLRRRLVAARRREGSPICRLSPGRLTRIVEGVLRRLPWRPGCLVRSSLLCLLLRRQGDGAHLVIGARLERHRLTSHAWVRMDGIDIGRRTEKEGSHRPLLNLPESAGPKQDRRR